MALHTGSSYRTVPDSFFCMDFADIFNGLMAIPNLIALVVLNGVVVAESRSYFKRLNTGQLDDGFRKK